MYVPAFTIAPSSFFDTKRVGSGSRFMEVLKGAADALGLGRPLGVRLE